MDKNTLFLSNLNGTKMYIFAVCYSTKMTVYKLWLDFLYVSIGSNIIINIKT